MDFITRGDRDLEHTELLYGRKSDQCVLHSILLNAEKEMKGNNGLRLGKQCKKEYIVITFVCDGNIVMFKHKTHWDIDKTSIKKQKTWSINKNISNVVDNDVYDLILNGNYKILFEKVYGGDLMDCTKCIYGYYYDTCNADWKNGEYQNMLKTHICPFFSEGNKMYFEQVE